MRNYIKSFAEFMNKLNNIQFTSPDGDSLVSSSKELTSVNGKWTVWYSYEEMTSLHDRATPIRIIIRVRYDGKHLTQWGCENNEENALFIEWFQKQRNAVNEYLYKQERLTEKVAQDMWNNL